MSKAYKEMKNSLYSQGFYTKRTLGRKNPVPKGCVVLQIGYKKYDIKGHELRQKILTSSLQPDEIERRRDSDEDMHSHAIKMGSSSFKKEHDSSDESEIPSDSENSDDNINKQ